MAGEVALARGVTGRKLRHCTCSDEIRLFQVCGGLEVIFHWRRSGTSLLVTSEPLRKFLSLNTMTRAYPRHEWMRSSRRNFPVNRGFRRGAHRSTRLRSCIPYRSRRRFCPNCLRSNHRSETKGFPGRDVSSRVQRHRGLSRISCGSRDLPIALPIHPPGLALQARGVPDLALQGDLIERISATVVALAVVRFVSDALDGCGLRSRGTDRQNEHCENEPEDEAHLDVSFDFETPCDAIMITTQIASCGGRFVARPLQSGALSYWDERTNCLAAGGVAGACLGLRWLLARRIFRGVSGVS